ncbi:sigma 54-interacting transcriptional regulator [Neobacillus sp. LXY-1]|uniref:sigma 54-interacting transcriptional regulator n=1 Tax=Neobacillus sp. LXY-1 TaxID=3379133 RepID=UPI003EDF63B2
MLQLKSIITPYSCLITEETTLQEAIDLMCRKKWNLLPVTDANHTLVGVFTRSSLHQMISKERPLNTPIKSFIKKQVETVRLDTPYEKIQQLVKTSKVGTGVVIDEKNRVVGILTKTDVVISLQHQLDKVANLIKKLEHTENKASFFQHRYQKSETAQFTWDLILSMDSRMEKLKHSGAKAARGRSTVLICGESGTGKELFAHAIHNGSPRSKGKFVVVNCAAIPESLLESEFFGYEEGAFTGAKNKGKQGKFDLADGGTLFLDEIGDMSLPLQAKLLRVLQEREFYRVGGMKRIKVDVRIIAATNRNLEEMMKEGTFREDLYYRLNVISLQIPPLRERIYDVDFLINEFIHEFNHVIGTKITGIEERARKVLLAYDWPGNVRELRNVLERAVTFAENRKIKWEDLPDYVTKQISLKEPTERISMVEHAELEAIKKALVQMKGNKVKAAKLLGISRSGLYEKLKKYNVPI